MIDNIELTIYHTAVSIEFATKSLQYYSNFCTLCCRDATLLNVEKYM